MSPRATIGIYVEFRKPNIRKQMRSAVSLCSFWNDWLTDRRALPDCRRIFRGHAGEVPNCGILLGM